ncbi:MAG: ThuA domain-containing protein [Gemmataceae bacterium]|nr:ThuA domain-containing protein [Gemmataceae bacterium]
MSLSLVASSLVALTLAAQPAPKRLLLVGQGPDGHPAGTHEYVAGLKILEKCLARVPGLEVTSVRANGAWREGPELLERADGVVLYLAEGAKWMHDNPRRLEALNKLTARGGAVVVLHWALGTRDAKYIDGIVKIAGGCHGGPDRKYKVLQTKAHIADPSHPIASGLADFIVRDEFYYRLKFARPEGSTKPVLRVRIDDSDETVAWSWERPDGGRSFGFSGLHFHENWRLIEYRRLVAQAVLWTLRLPVPTKGLDVRVADKELSLP